MLKEMDRPPTLRVAMFALAFALLGAPPAAGASSSAGDAAALVEVEGGTLRGAVRDGVVSFKGVPYAAQPVGALRWRPPQPAPAWSGERDARAFGASCLQPPRGRDSVYLSEMPPTSEDCLTLNVWAPVGAENAPVMVWVHGGALLTGAGGEPMYDGAVYARRGIVFVSINYRLGLLGFLAHPALSAESEEGVSGNYGLLDQVAALRWVRQNIAAFGGDPDRVTIAGESAGALSILALMTSPRAEGLFHRAIVQSGYMPSFPELRAAAREQRSAEAAGLILAEAAGADGAAALRAADPVRLFEAGLSTGWTPEPTIDGVVLPRQLAEAFARGEQARVPVLAGYNEGEIRSLLFFMPPVPESAEAYDASVRERFGAAAQRYLSIYSGRDPYADVMASMRDGFYGWAAQYAVRAQARLGLPAYLYYFRHATPAQRARNLAAHHASELTYMFARVDSPALGPNWPRPPQTESEARLAEAMVEYWASFVRTGEPQAPGEQSWPRYAPEEEAYLDIDERPAAARGLAPEAFAFADDLIAERLRQGRGWRFNIGFRAFPSQASAQ